MEEAKPEMEIPPFFLCPISLQLMRDPVTLTTGITYDRSSIRRWLATGNPTCPVTRRTLTNTELTPNSTLHRLISTWCAANHYPSPPLPVDLARILADLRSGGDPTPSALRQLHRILTSSEEARSAAEEAGAGEVLVQLIKRNKDNPDDPIAVLHDLQLSPEGLRSIAERNADVLEMLAGVLRAGTLQSRAYAVAFARSLLEAVSPKRLVGGTAEFFTEVGRVIRDRISRRATKVALRVAAELMSCGRNRVYAARAGIAEVIVELLLEAAESRRMWEISMIAMEMVVGCAEGRHAVAAHAAGIAVLSSGLLGISATTSGKAARVLCTIAKHAGSAKVLREMAEVGAVAKLCLLAGSVGGRTQAVVAEVLRLHSKTWIRSPCFSSTLLSSYLL